MVNHPTANLTVNNLQFTVSLKFMVNLHMVNNSMHLFLTMVGMDNLKLMDIEKHSCSAAYLKSILYTKNFN